MKKIPLTNSDSFALVDDRDFKRLSKITWRLLFGYAVHSNPRVTLRMHKLVLKVSKNKEVDHKDGNRLNNQRCNLREASHSQNLQNTGRAKHNTSGFKGVSYRPTRGKWMAQIQKDKRHYFLGYHLSPEEAARAYDRAAFKMYREFAKTNFPIRFPRR